jgi:hypothetical protein
VGLDRLLLALAPNPAEHLLLFASGLGAFALFRVAQATSSRRASA